MQELRQIYWALTGFVPKQKVFKKSEYIDQEPIAENKKEDGRTHIIENVKRKKEVTLGKQVRELHRYTESHGTCSPFQVTCP